MYTHRFTIPDVNDGARAVAVLIGQELGVIEQVTHKRYTATEQL